MASLQTLRTYYSNVMRVNYATVPAGDLATLADLAAKVDAGTLTLAAATDAVVHLAINTTSVATIAYQFFTGATPFAAGVDYLVSPTGGNANNINAAYYQSFNIENRYINFAVNLGKLGEGAARFQSQYGALTLSETLVKAYTELFGTVPDAAKTDSLLNSLVPNGAGGTYTRAEYFAFYGRDGANGIGTKAAMIGWLMAQAAKEDIGTYAKANDALLKDVAVDGIAKFHSDLVGVYGPAQTIPGGVTINFTNQSIAPDAANAAFRSTVADDTLNGTSGVNASQSVLAAAGHDKITIAGVMSGFIDGGAGNDVITVDTLDSPVAVLGVTQNGAIYGGDGNDTITVTTQVRASAVIDGGAGDDTATLTGASNQGVTIRNVEHLVSRGGTFDLAGVSGLLDFWSEGNGTLNNVPNGQMIGVRNTQPGMTFVEINYVAGTAKAEVHLDNVQGYPYGHISHSGMLGIIDPLNIAAFNVGTVTVSVDSDSAFGQFWVADGDTLVIKGAGVFSAAVLIGRQGASETLDASAAAKVNISHYGPWAQQANVTLSGGDDTISVALGPQGSSTFTLGAGKDYFSLYSVGLTTTRMQNLHITGSTIDRFATITDFTKGQDTIDLGAGTQLVGDMTQYIQAPPTLEAALIAVSSNVGVNQVGIFQWNGSTYLYQQDATVGVNTGDGLIKLAGVVGLTTGTGPRFDVDVHWGGFT